MDIYWVGPVMIILRCTIGQKEIICIELYTFFIALLIFPGKAFIENVNKKSKPNGLKVRFGFTKRKRK